MRALCVSVGCGAIVMAAALVVQAVDGSEVSGWLAVVAVALALAGMAAAGVRWASGRSRPAASSALSLVSIAVLATSGAAAGALVVQAVTGGAAAGWLAVGAVAALAVASLVARAL